MIAPQLRMRRGSLKEFGSSKRGVKVDAACGTDDYLPNTSFYVVVKNKSTSVAPAKAANSFQNWNARRKLGRIQYKEKACNRSLGKAQIMFCPPIDQDAICGSSLSYFHQLQDSPLCGKTSPGWMGRTLQVVRKNESQKKYMRVRLQRLGETDVRERSANFALPSPSTWASDTFSSSCRKVCTNPRIRKLKPIDCRENKDFNLDNLAVPNKDYKRKGSEESKGKFREDNINVLVYSSSNKNHRIF
eukprot:TRINITY_DN3843_c0_g2_i1.p1 TRINITY_DN3843_c0_g2~~TRINITY_DN3843_c0_g2_i1.p1  ORF type:complete len:245 (-),score=38.47 TRINITY_DN3843_c0_g2_i1:46-780(-)